MLRLLSQSYNSASVRVLAPHSPSAAERDNALTYANDIRLRLASAHHLHTTANTLDDVELISEAAVAGLSASALKSEVLKLASMAHVDVAHVQRLLLRFHAYDRKESGSLNPHEFANFMGFDEPNEYTYAVTLSSSI